MIIESPKKKNLILNLRDFNLWIIIKKIHTTTIQKSSIVFIAVKDENYLI